jgi:hypothetical protein
MVRVLLLILGAFHLGNGLWMLVDPMSWYGAIPGVAQTGPLNHHFVQDVGMEFIASGGFFAAASFPSPRAGTLAIAGATWPLLHALIHVAGWIEHGLPSDPRRLFSDAVGVVALAVLGGALAWFRTKGET